MSKENQQEKWKTVLYTYIVYIIFVGNQWGENPIFDVESWYNVDPLLCPKRLGSIKIIAFIKDFRIKS